MEDDRNMGGRYISPLTDYGFKKVFGDKDIMMAFLTDLLTPSSPIEEVIFLDKELKAEDIYMRSVIYDLRCKTQDGEEFIVEMQNNGQTYFSSRILYYLSHAVASQGGQGRSWDFELHPVYGVFFLNFHLSGFKPQAIRTIQLKVDETGELFTEKLKAFTLELVDFKDKPEAYPKTQVEYWLYNLVNMDSMTEALPFQAQQPIFGKMGGLSELCRMNKAERSRYMDSLNMYRTNLAVMKHERKDGHAIGHAEGLAEGIIKGRAEGLEEGRAEGRSEGLVEGRAEGRSEGLEEGRAESRREIAKNLKGVGMDAATISQMTGLSVADIEQL